MPWFRIEMNLFDDSNGPFGRRFNSLWTSSSVDEIGTLPQNLYGYSPKTPKTKPWLRNTLKDKYIILPWTRKTQGTLVIYAKPTGQATIMLCLNDWYQDSLSFPGIVKDILAMENGIVVSVSAGLH